MLHLIWGLLNITLFLFFLFTCFKATKFIRDNLGLLASLVFVVGLLSFMGHADFTKSNQDVNKNKSNKWTFAENDDAGYGRSDFQIAELDKNILSKYQIGIVYKTDTASGNKIPISATSFTSGMVSGIHWQPELISTNYVGNGKNHEFTVTGNVVWKLLGITLFSQSKTYKISVALD